MMTGHTYINPLDKLSEEERRIAELLGAGMNTSEIAKRLSLRYQAVAEIGQAIRYKLGVTSLIELRTLVGGRSRG